MGVLNPIKLVVLNYPEDKKEFLETQNNPEDPSAGTRQMPFGRELWMEADDFKVDVNKKWFRLAPGRVVRLKSAYIVEYVDHVEDESGAVTEVHVNYFSNSKSGQDVSGIKAKGTRCTGFRAKTPSMPKCACMIGCFWKALQRRMVISWIASIHRA